MKLKSNGTYRAKINMRRYEQEDGEHYDSASISFPVTNDVSIRVMLTLMLMAQMRAYIVDVKVLVRPSPPWGDTARLLST